MSAPKRSTFVCMHAAQLSLLLLGSVGQLGPTEASSPLPAPQAAVGESAPFRFSALEISAGGVDTALLLREIDLRLPELHVYLRAEHAAVEASDGPFLYVEIVRGSAGTEYSLRLVTSDGRVFERQVLIDEHDEPERVLASTIANNVLSIESGAVTPDRRDSAIPRPVADSPTTSPVSPTADRENPPVGPAPLGSRQPRLQIGVAANTGVLLGPGQPVYGDIFLGWFGGLGLTMRTRSGILGLAEFRGGGRRVGDAKLRRLRVYLGGGYSWRFEHLEVAAALLLAVEPWRVRPGEGLIISGTTGEAAAFPPLLGAALVLSPGYYVSLGQARALRIGPRVELVGGFVVSEAGPRVAGAGVRTESGQLQPLFRLGGAELFSGIEFALWFDAPGRSH